MSRMPTDLHLKAASFYSPMKQSSEGFWRAFKPVSAINIKHAFNRTFKLIAARTI